MALVLTTCETAKEHFTYCLPEGDIKQGDVITKSPEIGNMLRSDYPFFDKPEFTHFIVLTQSCDLTRDNKTKRICKAPYITVSPVTPLERVLEDEISIWQGDLARAAGVCKESDRQKAAELTRRIMNNNNAEYFYLHQSARQKLVFPTNSCAVLRLSFSVRSEDWYEVWLRNRILSLDAIFAAKLGFLISEIYSRVGTKDWPDYFSAESFAEHINETLDGIFTWIHGEKLATLEKQLKGDGEIHKVVEMDMFYLRKKLYEIPDRANRMVEAVDRIIEIVEGEKPLGASPEQIDDFRAALLADKVLQSCIRR